MNNKRVYRLYKQAGLALKHKKNVVIMKNVVCLSLHLQKLILDGQWTLFLMLKVENLLLLI